MLPPVFTEPELRAFSPKGRLSQPAETSEPRLIWNDLPSGDTRSYFHVSHPFLDVALVCLAGYAIYALRYGILQRLINGTFAMSPLGYRFSGLLLVYGTVVVLCCQTQDLYRSRDRFSVAQEITAVLKAVTYATLIAIAFIYLLKWDEISRIVLLLIATLTFAVTIGWRLCKRVFQKRRFAKGHGVRNVLIIGAGKVGQNLAHYLQEHKELGLEVKGFLDHFYDRHPKVLGSIDDLLNVARQYFIDEVFISIPSEREIVRQIVLEAHRNRWDVKVIPELFDGLGHRAPIRYFGDLPIMDVYSEPIPKLGLFFKRVIDIIGSAAALIVLAPIMLLIAVAIRINSHGPAIYSSLRVGKKGRKFQCYKFRTMIVNADALKSDLLHMNERSGPFFKISNDPRVTRLGQWLRNLSLDELPQFWNVLIGDMSLIGPRPHAVDDFQKYTLRDLRRLDVTPGVSGLWQVTARRDPSFEKNLALDIYYIENWSIRLDLEIMVRTIPALAKGQ